MSNNDHAISSAPQYYDYNEGSAILDEIRFSDTVADLRPYREFHRRLCSLINESALGHETNLSKVKPLQTEIDLEIIAVDKISESRQAQKNAIEMLDKDYAEVQEQALANKANDTKPEIDEMKEVYEDAKCRLQDIMDINAKTVKPELERLTKALVEVETDRQLFEELYRQEETGIEKLKEIQELIKDEVGKSQAVAAEKEQDAERAKEEVEKKEALASSLAQEMYEVEIELGNLRSRSAELATVAMAQRRRRRDSSEAEERLRRKLEVQKETIARRQREVGALECKLRLEKAGHHQIVTRTLELELTTKELNSKIRLSNNSLILERNQLDRMKREYKRRKIITDSIVESITPLDLQLTDIKHIFRKCESENNASIKQISKLKGEIDESIVRFMKQENIKQQHRDLLDDLAEELEAKEEKLKGRRTKETDLNKLVSKSDARHQIKARVVDRRHRQVEEAGATSDERSLYIIDLQKKRAEMRDRLTEFEALCGAILSERNKYASITKNSEEGIQEITKKSEVLKNEVSFLQDELSQMEEKAVQEESQARQSLNYKSVLHQKLLACKEKFGEDCSVRDRKLIEIGRLKCLIRKLERGMHRLSTKYEKCRSAKVLIESKLDKSSREVQYLYEKANIREQTLKQGEMKILDKDREIRLLELKMSDAHRTVDVLEKRLTIGANLDKRMNSLAKELAEEKLVTKEVCSRMENPQNKDRTRELIGNTPEKEELEAKLKVMENKLHNKKEQILNRECDLEDLSELMAALKVEAGQAREENCVMNQQLMEMQSKIHDVTRKTCAAVGELRMYRSLAERLQHEKINAMEQLDECKDRLKNGKSLGEEVRREWDVMRKNLISGGSDKHQTEEDPGRGNFDKERPNAYICGSFGVPKPFGNMAPFKPSQIIYSQNHLQVKNANGEADHCLKLAGKASLHAT